MWTDGRRSQLTWKDGLIALLLLLLTSMTALALRGRASRSGAERAESSSAEKSDPSVFDVVADRAGRTYIDVLFDRPVAESRWVRSMPSRPPATIAPSHPGVWRWVSESVLRFEAAGQLPLASEFEITILPGRLGNTGRKLAGPRKFEVAFDRFLVEDVGVEEDLASRRGGPPDSVVLSGWIRFNYAVDPDLLASRLRLEDPRGKSRRRPEVFVLASSPREVLKFRTSPIVKSDKARSLRLVVAGDLVSRAGNVRLGRDHVTEVPLGGRTALRVRRVDADPRLEGSQLRVTMSAPVSAAVAAKYLRVDPEVEFKVTAERNVLYLVGGFSPGENYRLIVEDGLPAEDGAVLQEREERSVRFPNLRPSIAFRDSGVFLSRAGAGNVAVDSVNVEKTRLIVDRVYENNLLFLFQRGDFGSEWNWGRGRLWRPLGDRVVDKTLEIESQRNRQTTTVLSLGNHLDLDRPGLYRVLITQPDDYRSSQRWILNTDLGAVVKRSGEDLLVWALSSRDLMPAGGADIEVVSDQNQLLGRGRADRAGFWTLEEEDRLAEGDPYFILLRSGDDVSFVHLGRMAIDTGGLDVAGATAASDAYSAFVYGERDLYRPGETLHGVALVRDGDLRPAPAMPVLVRHRRPDGNEVSTRSLEIDERGLFELEWEIPRDAPTGAHSFELVVARQTIGNYRFHVEEFVPDRIKVEIRPDSDAVQSGGELRFDVTSQYLFGPPAVGLAAETRVRLESSFFSPDGFPGFSFSSSEREFSGREVLAEKTRLDEEGAGSFSLVPPEVEVPSSLRALITSRVQESGGRGVTAHAVVPVHPVPYYVGVRRLAEGYAELGAEMKFEVVAVRPGGTLVPEARLVAELVHDRWQTVLRRGPNGNYRYKSVRDPIVLESRTLRPEDGRGSVSFAARSYGRHRVVIRDSETGAAADVFFYASGWGYSPWAVENPARVDLDLDKTEYRAGETATVQVRAPFAGKLLLTVERDRVLSRQVHVLDGNTAAIEIPVLASYRPNVYLTATLVRGVEDLEPGGVGRAFGAVPLTVERETRRLGVTLSVEEQVRSETRLTVGVETGPGAVVTVAAVDEGILQLIAQKTADPFAFFYRKLALGVRSYDTFSLLLPEIELAEAGGGAAGGLTQQMRTEGIRRVKPVAFWSGVVEADTHGKAGVDFELPEFQGALRIMAVAADGQRFGASEEIVRVRDPLVLTPTLPRVLSFDERLEVPVVVRNDTGRPGVFDVTLAVEGEASTSGTGSLDVELANGAEQTVYFSAETSGRSGAASFRLTVEGNGERALRKVDVPVRPDLPETATRVSGSITDAVFALPPVEGDFRQVVSRSLTVGNFPLVQFGDRLRGLLRYPYGCLEQTVSKAFPLIYLEDLAQELGRRGEPGVEWRRADHYIDEALRKIAYQEVTGGGFGLWPGASSPHRWASVYATHFMVEADRAGHPVAPELLRRGLRYLETRVKATSNYDSLELERAAYALFVLARAGRPDLGTMDFLRARQIEKMRSESRGLLAAAYAATGNRTAAGELTSGITEVADFKRETGNNLRSALRSRAMLLLALLDAAPDSSRVASLADRLARDAAAVRYWTTQESAFTFLALGQLARRQQDRGDYSGRVYDGERLVGRFGSETAVFEELPSTSSLRVEMDEGYQPGAAFFQLESRGVPTDESFRPQAEGLQIERKFWSRDRRPVDLEEIRQGDLVVIETRVRSARGRVDNVVIENRLPSGLEVENPRLSSTETIGWIDKKSPRLDHLDLRDDRILLFTSIPGATWQRYYSLVRAVAPGTFRLPPAHVEAMYDPALQATGERGFIRVSKADGVAE